MAFSGRLREIAAALDPSVQVRQVERVALTLSVVVLCAAGIYAMMSCTVEQRRKEIGIRAALGADSRRLLAAIFARALAQLAVGALFGAGIGILLDIASEGELMAGNGGILLPAVSLFMMSVGLLAAWGPARRGLRIHPIDTLRAE